MAMRRAGTVLAAAAFSLWTMSAAWGQAAESAAERRAHMTALAAFNEGAVAVDPAALPAALARYRGDARLRAALAAVRDDPALRDAPAESVAVDKLRLPPDGDPHSFWSIGSYWHPDPDKPDGLPYIRRDGVYNEIADNPRNDRHKLHRMGRNAFAWAAVAYFGEDDGAAGRALGHLRAWFVDPATRMNPHLEYAQAIPGRTEGRGIGIIDTVGLLRAAAAVELLDARLAAGGRPAAGEAETLAGVRAWFGAYLDWMLTSKNGLAEMNEHNNHGTWYDAQVLAFAVAAGRKDVAPAAAERLRGRAAAQVAADGSMPHELSRTRSWTYSIYNTLGFTSARVSARALGLALGDATDARIRASVDYLRPYGEGAKPWTREQIGGFDAGAYRPLLAEAAAAFPEAYGPALAAFPGAWPGAAEFFPGAR